jgi:hypothetical protein
MFGYQEQESKTSDRIQVKGDIDKLVRLVTPDSIFGSKGFNFFHETHLFSAILMFGRHETLKIPFEEARIPL